MTEPHPHQEVELLLDPHYAFDDKGPFYSLSHDGSYPITQYVDPAPCYHHDVDLVRRLFERLRTRAPLPIPMRVFILGHEPVSRVNGWYHDNRAYSKDDDTSIPVGTITLAGKRIPIHPAITRYLVTHEYGHGVFYHLARISGYQDAELKELYIQEVRPEAKVSYGPGKWHSNIGEVFANDFRILVMQEELEFWPHAGLTDPDHCPAAITFWNNAWKELGWCE